MILLDIVVATLLLATIIYSWKLSRSISTFRSSKREMADFINQFGHSLVQAENSIAKLKMLNKEIDSELRVNIERARFLANDLSFLIHKGNDVANRIEGQVVTPQPSLSQIKKPSVNSNDFVKRAERIVAGDIKEMPRNMIKPIDSASSKKLAIEEALATIARTASKNQILVKTAQRGAAPDTKEKRLFDFLKKGKQIERVS